MPTYKFAVCLLFSVAALFGANKPESQSVEDPASITSIRTYGIHGQVKGLFGEPLPKTWFQRPVAAQSSFDSYSAVLSPIQDVSRAELTLINEAPVAEAAIVVEVRDGNGLFAEKFLIQIPQGEERSVSLHQLSKYKGVQVSLFSTAPFAAFHADQGTFVEIEVRKPSTIDALDTHDFAKSNNCTTIAKRPIRITHNSPGGGSVNAWASVSQFPATQYPIANLTVYYPTSSYVYHYPVATTCYIGNTRLRTALAPGQTNADHTWSNAAQALTGYGSGTVYCDGALTCSPGETWTYELR